jgi:hypothetical protein
MQLRELRKHFIFRRLLNDARENRPEDKQTKKLLEYHLTEMEPLSCAGLSCRTFIWHSGQASDVRFAVFAAVTENNAVFLYVTQCGSCKNRRFGGAYFLHQQGDKNRRARKNLNCN